MFAERRLSTLAAGTTASFPDDVKSLRNNEQNLTHSVGAIGTSRPGSRIAQFAQAPFSQVTSLVSNQPLWVEAQGPGSSATSQTPRELPATNEQPGSEFEASSRSSGYGLSSSMWAAPTLTGCQPHLPHQDRLHTPGFATIPLLGEYDPKPNSLRTQPEPGIPFVKNGGSPAGKMSNTLKPSQELPLSRFDNIDSPALSFTQTVSAPSTGGSFFPSDGSPPHTRNGLFNSYPMAPSDEHSPYGLAIKQFDAPCASSHHFAIDKALSEHPWPPAMSFGEEAFYSKSNVTKTKNSSAETGSAANSPGLWRPLDVSLPLPHRSPSNDKPCASLASPATVQPHGSGILSQLLSRVEQLERKTTKQDQEIHQMKAKISLVGAQSQREHQVNSTMSSNVPSGANFPNHAPSGNAFPTSFQTRMAPLGNPAALNNVNVAAGLNIEDHMGVATNGHPGPPNNGLHARPPEESSTQGAIVSTMNAGYLPRQFGPLDYSTRRVSIAPGVTMMPQPLQAPAPVHGVPPCNAPGIVNYRALLSGDTECDYEYFIRRITKHNDQQASIFLQQKLKQSALAQSAGGEKNEPAETRHTGKPRKAITKLVIDLSWELMTNRFGNFLVSRAIEHATSGERLELAKRIAGHIVTLAQDTFATHCLQKMIDVDEEGENRIRKMISEELLQKKETVTHKSAGHVWARLLSVGGGSSNTISLSTGTEKATGRNQYGDSAGKSGDLERSLNELLRGEWATTAKDEVGSLIVQSVLENWNEASKEDVVEELLADIYSCAVQQWGNFVILHLIEHSTGAIQKKLFQRLTETQLACELSVDNFGAKAIEKVLKVSGMESSIVEDYVKAICEYGHGRPALIDIACHQAGAQVLTLLFTSAPNSIRDLMIQTVRRNGVTMKSSKAGSKIWFLVERTRAWVGH